MKNSFKIIILCTLVLLSGCATKRIAENGVPTPAGQTKTSGNTAADKTRTSGNTAATKSSKASSFAFVQKVNDNKVMTQNIVADMTFSASTDDKDVSVPGSLHMRKDKIIRLQLFVPIIHSEVGRLEFTPDYVLVVDRIHKQYIKEDYNKLDFLRDNGLNFYSLQALFWNQLFLPGKKTVGEADLSTFVAEVTGNAGAVPVSYAKGGMSYLWYANGSSGRITNARVTYSSSSYGNSTLTWRYSNFKALGAKTFPAYQTFSFQTTATRRARKVTVTLDMDGIKTTDRWNMETTLSPKYKKIESTDIFGKLFQM